jgi:hypothetical protein
VRIRCGVGRTVAMRAASTLIILLCSTAAAAPSDYAAVTSPDLLYDCPHAEAVNQAEGDLEMAFARLQDTPRVNRDSNTIPCAVLSAGWWHYEVCWQRYIRQFHVENQRITAEYFLGLGPVALSADDSTMNRLSRYPDGDRSAWHQVQTLRTSTQWRAMELTMPKDSTALLAPGDGHQKCSAWLDARLQQMRFATKTQLNPTTRIANPGAAVAAQSPATATIYTAGTICDVTNRPRRTLVVLTCEARDQYIGFNVTEESPCNYVVYIYGMAVCKALRQPHQAQGHTTQQPTSHTVASLMARKPAAQTDSNAAPRDTAEEPIAKPSLYPRGHKGPVEGESQIPATVPESDSKCTAAGDCPPTTSKRPSEADQTVTLREDPPDDGSPLYEGSLIFSL